MRRAQTTTLATTLLLIGLADCCLCDDSAAIKAQWDQPPRDYSTGPLWVWNDLLTDEQIVSTLRDLSSQQVRQVWVHPRPGLMTPYLSDEWFRLWKLSLAHAEQLDMNVWIYDENSYPSGFAGGLVPEAMPQSRGQGLVLREVEQVPEWSDQTIAVYRLDNSGYVNVSERARGGQRLPEGRYVVAQQKLAESSGWFGGKYYVDLIKTGVTEKFIELTLEPYRKRVGDQFGKRLPGVFTDEPHLFSWGATHWSDDLPQRFHQRWGYQLTDHLPALRHTLGDWKRVRHNYQQLLLEEFIEHWARPMYRWCDQQGLEFTGHYWEHGWPGASHNPDNMATAAWQHRPGIDTLFNQYAEGPNAQFGNVRAVKEIASVANQLGRRRTFCEAYGAAGWELRFEDMKRIGDWLYVLGVNTLNEHLSFITIRGARKRDHPQSFSYHEPWWEAYHVLSGYFTRLSLALSSGQESNRIVVLEPTTTAWMYQNHPRLAQIGDRFQQLITDLSKAQVEYDLACEDGIGRWGSVEGAKLVIGSRAYDTVVLPPMTENLNATTVDVLAAYLQAGGLLIACDEPPSRVDGEASLRVKQLSSQETWRRTAVDELAGWLLTRQRPGVTIKRSSQDQGILFHHRRLLEDGELLFLVNTSIDHHSRGTIEATCQGIEQWDAHTGQVRPFAFQTNAQGVAAEFDLPACGSLLLFLSKDSLAPAARATFKTETIPAASPMQIRRLEPNVLTLDFVDVTIGGQSRERLYCASAGQFVFQQHGLSGNPWDRAVQLRDKLITKEFPPASGFQATYRFTIEGAVPTTLRMVIERADLYTITCNGKPVEPLTEAWWLDKSFRVIDISGQAKVGENAVTIQANPLTMWHELEPAYVLGDFHLRPAQAGFHIAPAQRLKMPRGAAAGWNRQGCPFYGQRVAYTQQFDVPAAVGRYVVKLNDWHGSVAKVVVNGETAGYLGWRPWQRDVTSQIKPGSNTIEVVVIGTLKNTLGPHHIQGLRGIAGPGHFLAAPKSGPPPGSRYDTIGYGLFEPFVLQHIVSQQ